MNMNRLVGDMKQYDQDYIKEDDEIEEMKAQLRQRVRILLKDLLCAYC